MTEDTSRQPVQKYKYLSVVITVLCWQRHVGIMSFHRLKQTLGMQIVFALSRFRFRRISVGCFVYDQVQTQHGKG
jgi:hypothetical protein